ncbi:MAG: Type 1 glutamine amidotransferase-like domain-containing protein [Microcoleaceae cyanobacterium MO_207.B10]|nr:Type 1 glutamine amidotransferase-like domain-containing protein [Microcoleaceae cyanobacterium MO_207.B10]
MKISSFYLTILLTITVILSFILMIILPLPVEAKPITYLDGNTADVNPSMAAFAYNLGGGGHDVDAAIQWMINQVRGCNTCSEKVDVVVVRDSGDAAYNQIILAMDGVDSVETLVISQREDADSQNIIDKIQNAEVVFFGGGDQCNYVRNYINTGVERAIKSVVERGGAIGGTSAGAMIQSDFVFSACSETVTSETALMNPYEDVYLDSGLFFWEHLQNTIIDTHFYERDRMGRLMTFVARLLRDGKANRVLGIGIDEGTSLIVHKNGLAKVIGDGYVYFILGDHLPEKCEPQTAVSFSDFHVWKKGNGETFDLKNRPSVGDFQVSVKDGKLMSSLFY